MCWKVVLGLVDAMNVGAVVVSANGFFVIFAGCAIFWVGCTSQQFGWVLCMGTDRLTSEDGPLGSISYQGCIPSRDPTSRDEMEWRILAIKPHK